MMEQVNTKLPSRISAVGGCNPFRYRGYYYDTETGFYYLQTRYYDPQVCRFLNADGIIGANGGIQGYNMFAYCNNNPVMNYDPDGSFFLTGLLIGLAVGAAIGFGATVYADYADDGEVFNGSIETKDYVLNTLFGGLIGSAAGLAAPYIASFAASSFTLSFPTGFALAGGGTAVIAATITGAQILEGVAALGLGILMFSRPNSGRIRFSDSTGKDPRTGKEFTDKKEAYEYYKNHVTDPLEKTKMETVVQV